MSSPWQCPSCKRPFSARGHMIQHFDKTSNANCQRAGEELRATLRQPFRHDLPRACRLSGSSANEPSAGGSTATDSTQHADSAPQSASEPTPEPEPMSGAFEGDYFGAAEEYSDEDFPFEAPEVEVNGSASSTAVHEASDSESDDEDEIVGKDTLETNDRQPQPPSAAPVAGRPHSVVPLSPGRVTPDPPPAGFRDDDAMDIDPPQSLPPRDPSAPPPPPLRSPPPPQPPPSGPGGVAPHDHEQLRACPIHFDRYAGRAGEVKEDTDSVPTSQYHSYSTKLGHDGSNPYAPFHSRIDWEIARWAKMRGPTSTAFSELLSIDGVSSIVIS